MAAGLAAGQEVTRWCGRVCAYGESAQQEKKGQTEKDAKPSGPRPPLPEDEGRVEGLKSSSTGEKRKVGEAVMQKSDMKTGRGRGRD